VFGVRRLGGGLFSFIVTAGGTGLGVKVDMCPLLAAVVRPRYITFLGATGTTEIVMTFHNP